jgi:hypothetical protein
MIRFKKYEFVLWILFSVVFLAFTFGDSRSEYILPSAAYSVSSGDLDMDGSNDIVVGHNYNFSTSWGGISLLHNNGFGQFTLTDSLYLFGWQTSINIEQINANPFPEIIFSKENGATEFIGLIFDNNISDTIFLNANTYEGINNIDVGDLNNDENNDIVFTSANGNFWGVFYNYSTGNFSSPEYHYVTGYSPLGLAIGDLDNDGRDDVVLCGQSVEVWFSYSTGGYIRLVLEENNYKSDVAIADFDRDGDNDIITEAGVYLVNVTSVIMYENLGNRQFDTIPEFWFQPSASIFSVTDFNNDTLPDILFQVDNCTGHIIYYNQGNFQLADSQFVAVANYGESIRNCHCADLDNNGFNDIITLRTVFYYGMPNLDIRFNDGNGNFGPDPIVADKHAESNKSFSFRNYPNPFGEETTFIFSIQENSKVEILIYSSQGQLFKHLIKNTEKGGVHSIKWRGLDETGKSCKPGACFATLRVNGKIRQSIKLIKY